MLHLSSPDWGAGGGVGKAESDHWGSIIHFRGFQWLFLGTHGPFESHDLVISKRRPYFSLLLALPRALSSLKHQLSVTGRGPEVKAVPARGFTTSPLSPQRSSIHLGVTAARLRLQSQKKI